MTNATRTIRIRRQNGQYKVWLQHRRRGAVDACRFAYDAKIEAADYAAQLQEIWGGEIVWG
jgi:hypothetical protein